MILKAYDFFSSLRDRINMQLSFFFALVMENSHKEKSLIIEHATSHCSYQFSLFF